MREFKSKNVLPQLAVREGAHGAQQPHPAIVIGGAPPVSGPVATYGAPDPAIVARDRDMRLRAMVDRYLDFVPRVLRNAGTPDAEIDDEVQRTFITAARRLDDVRPGAEKGFLFKIALNLAAHARRTLARRREVLAEEAPERNETFPTPEQLTDQKRMRQLLDRVLDRMDESLRVVFVLYEFEEMNMSEIADVLEIPRGTVASRLRRARAEFRERVAALEGLARGDQREPSGQVQRGDKEKDERKP
jgi:RNA polymerase sigma-70 factor (ECF subfamily)